MLIKAKGVKETYNLYPRSHSEMKKQLQTENLIILESCLYRTTTTIIMDKDYLLLVDPNWVPEEIDFIKNEVEKYGKGKNRYLLFTHSDYDHIIGYGKFNDFKTIASREFVENPNKDKIVAQIKSFDDQYYIKRDYGISYPEIDLVIDGDEQELI